MHLLGRRRGLSGRYEGRHTYNYGTNYFVHDAEFETSPSSKLVDAGEKEDQPRITRSLHPGRCLFLASTFMANKPIYTYPSHLSRDEKKAIVHSS
jgi:hypothetical protein